jgi:hypothetical protein
MKGLGEQQMKYAEQVAAIIALLLVFWVWLTMIKNNLRESKDKNSTYKITDFDRLVSVIFAGIIFIFSWYYCISNYGYLFGFGLGWIPSAISGLIVFFSFPYVFQLLKIIFVVAYPFVALLILFEVFS